MQGGTMMLTIDFDDGIRTSGQPTAEQLARLGADGWKSVANFRIEGEQPGMTSTVAEEEAVRKAGVEYHSYPLEMKRMRALPRPLLAHCQSGKRAAAVILIDEAIRRRLSGAQALRLGEEKGIEWDQPELRDFVADYVNSRRRA
jgi:protein tyrosine phosphatase (PTP) superfamily phosphohydrolase (DUF442 family)